MAQEKKYIPELRFPEFKNDGEWNSDTMENIFEIRNGYTPSKSNPEYWEGGTIPWFRMEDIRTNGHVLSDSIQHITPLGVKGSGLFPAYSIIVATTATIGEHALIIVDSLANQRFTFLTKRKSFEDKLDMLYFHYYMFIIDEWCKKNTNAGGLLSVNMDSFKKLTIPYPPSLSEQRKIAECFISLDKQIDSTKEKLKQLKEHKKGLMQRLFPTKGKTTPEFRFSEFLYDGEWDSCPVAKIFDRVTRKNKGRSQNVLTISSRYGLVSQFEYFNKNVAAADLANYYLIEEGDFAYNKSRSQGYPYGVIRSLKSCKEGVVSPIYLCFRLKDYAKHNNDYFEHLFDSDVMSSEIGKVAQEGARNHGLLNIPTDNFFNIIFVVIPPSKEEQDKIALCLSSLDKLILAYEKSVSIMKQHKKALMHQLFPEF